MGFCEFEIGFHEGDAVKERKRKESLTLHRSPRKESETGVDGGESDNFASPPTEGHVFITQQLFKDTKQVAKPRACEYMQDVLGSQCHLNVLGPLTCFLVTRVL